MEVRQRMKLTGTNRSFGLIALIYQCPLAIIGGPAHILLDKTSHTPLCFAGLVALARGPNPIPFRTRPLNPSAPMVLSLKAWESRSPPGLPNTDASNHTRHLFSTDAGNCHVARTRSADGRKSIAGWSSPVARQAHNLKVIGSNPIPATTFTEQAALSSRAAFFRSPPDPSSTIRAMSPTSSTSKPPLSPK